jgi:hypothetical protein
VSNDLAAPADIADFPGAPFTDALVDAAVSDLRGEAGWHIAPSRADDEVELDASGGVWLFLPSLYVTAVTLVEDTSSDVAVPITDYKVKRNGRLYRAGGWPPGINTVRVTMTHGYAETPPDLLPVIAGRCQFLAENSAYTQEGTGPFSAHLRDPATQATVTSSALSRYRLIGFG